MYAQQTMAAAAGILLRLAAIASVLGPAVFMSHPLPVVGLQVGHRSKAPAPHASDTDAIASRQGSSLPVTAEWACRNAQEGEGCGPYFNAVLQETGGYCPTGYCCSVQQHSCTNLPFFCSSQTQYLEAYSHGRCSKAGQCWKCGPNAKCVPVGGSHGGVYCDCTPPYVGKGGNCTAKECEKTNLCGNGVCLNTEEAPYYTCKCDPGYTLFEGAGKRPMCVDLCTLSPCGADAAVAACVSGSTDYMCMCNPGYKLTAVGNGQKSCQPFNPCDVSPCGPPEAVETCVKDGISYSCSCKPGFVLRYTSRQAVCVTEADCVPPGCTDKAPEKPVIPSPDSGESSSPGENSSNQGGGGGNTDQPGGSGEDNPRKENSGNTGTILGAVAGSVGGLLLLCGAGYLIMRSRRGRERSSAGRGATDFDVPRTQEGIFDDGDDKALEGPVYASWNNDRSRNDSNASSGSTVSSSSSSSSGSSGSSDSSSSTSSSSSSGTGTDPGSSIGP
ncbi:egf family domain-containing protein [Cystoisospora suis]|uniref:Egf family domain-containing protein n=1 Tax=Cystoisospora suis TaxID=483139 RepID=A0A2C6L2V6_9APIC|nr:egf family domain-containing protein [Cystoisospora suis]